MFATAPVFIEKSNEIFFVDVNFYFGILAGIVLTVLVWPMLKRVFSKLGNG